MKDINLKLLHKVISLGVVVFIYQQPTSLGFFVFPVMPVTVSPVDDFKMEKKLTPDS